MRQAIKNNPSSADSALAGIDQKSESKYQENQIVYSQGDPAVFVLYVRAGRLKVTMTSDQGKEAIVAIHLPGNFCGEECLTGHRLRRATVAALTECELVQMPKASVIRALHDNAQFSELFMTYLMERSIRVQDDLVDQLFNSTEKRLARLLLILANYGTDDVRNSIMPKINQEALAEMIGTTRTRVNFFMNKFRQAGFIEYSGNIKVNSRNDIKINRSLLNMVLHEKPQIAQRD
jgi:CRP/FNR family transcriptional regulator, cyclic AMP receptor protein